MLPAEMDIADERLVLHPHRAIYWERMHWLIVSDLQLGKAAHCASRASSVYPPELNLLKFFRKSISHLQKGPTTCAAKNCLQPRSFPSLPLS